MKNKTDPYTAGEFRFPVTIERPQYGDDGSGGQSTVWVTHIENLMCAVENRQGSEPYSDSGAGRVRTFQKYIFTTWFRTDIEQTDRIRFQGDLFNIRNTNNIQLRNKFLQIEADAGVEQ
jgi:SPP1 family predicted phage head-tail adaptor